MRQSDATTPALPGRPAGFRVRPLRLYVDLSPVGTSQDAELARLLAAGARPADVGQRGDEGWHVLADPEGNEFCLPRRPLAT
jgi:Glyoxalase-like domain